MHLSRAHIISLLHIYKCVVLVEQTTRISVKSMGLLTALLSINATARHQAAAAGNEKDGQCSANASSLTPEAKHAVPAVAAIMRRMLRPIASAYTGAESLIQVGQIICICGERVTPNVARTDVTSALGFLQLAGKLISSRFLWLWFFFFSLLNTVIN